MKCYTGRKMQVCFTLKHNVPSWRHGGLVVRASDSRVRGRGFDPHSGRRVVSLSKIHLPPK